MSQLPLRMIPFYPAPFCQHIIPPSNPAHLLAFGYFFYCLLQFVVVLLVIPGHLKPTTPITLFLSLSAQCAGPFQPKKGNCSIHLLRSFDPPVNNFMSIILALYGYFKITVYLFIYYSEMHN